MPVAIENDIESRSRRTTCENSDNNHWGSAIHRQILQLIGQHLNEYGLERVTKVLLEDADIALESAESAELRKYVKEGQWTQAAECLEGMRAYLSKPSQADDDMQEMKWLMCEQEIRELGRGGHYAEALATVRMNMKLGLKDVHERVKSLIWELITDADTTPEQSGHLNNEGRSTLLSKLQMYFPPDVMLPPFRLQTLIAQAMSYQRQTCMFHVTATQPPTTIDQVLNIFNDSDSLLVDHHCDRASFPCKMSQRIHDHEDEVWFCKFNHSGTLLASGSKDGRIITWKVQPETHTLEMASKLSAAPYGVAFISWSPDDTMILCAGAENCKEATVWEVQTGNLLTRFTRSGDDRMTAGGWYKDSRRFVVGGITGKFFSHCIETGRTEEWEGVRVQGLQVLSDDTILVADNLKRIRGFRFDTLKSSEILTEESGIITFTVNSTEDTILVNVVGQGIHLWDLRSRNLIGRYRGVVQGTFLNHSTFGGALSQFIASGSEDGTVAIWSRSNGDPIVVLRGHSGTVNCATWNPTLPTMIVSASDDRTLCCWAPERYALDPQPTIEPIEDRHRAAQLGPDGSPY